MSAGLEANPPDGISLPEEHERKITALRQALIEGENSGEAEEIDIKKIKATGTGQAVDVETPSKPVSALLAERRFVRYALRAVAGSKKI